MSIEGSFTDFHIDFGGSAVWYHVMKGKKIFYVAPPTETNLARYRKWSASHKASIPDSSVKDALHEWFFGNRLEDCKAVHLVESETVCIPSGWIHAVYTPVDSVAFGGNFLTGLNIPMQLTVDAIDQESMNDEYRYPLFAAVLWFAAKHMYECLYLNKGTLSTFEFNGIESLVTALKNQWEKLEKCTKLSAWQKKTQKAAFRVRDDLKMENPLELLNALQLKIQEVCKIRVPTKSLSASRKVRLPVRVQQI